MKFGEIQNELLYDACENGLPDFAENIKEIGPIIGFHLRWTF